MRYSIIVPVYNASRYLRACLNSVLTQTFTDIEVICVDDGSTDASGKILDEYAAKDARFRVVHQANGGEGAARNAGLSLAEGEIVGWLDADDLLDEGALSEVDGLFTRHNPDMVRFRHRRFSGETCEKISPQCHGVEEILGREQVRKWALRVLTGAGYCWVTFIKREKFSHEFPVGVQYAGDALFMLSNVCSLDRIVQSEYVGYYYRDVPNSIMKKPFPSAERLQFLKAFEPVASQYGRYDSKLAWMAWFNLVNWCRRPKDCKCAREIRNQFRRLVSCGYVRVSGAPFYARPAYFAYVYFNQSWTIRATYWLIGCLVRARSRLAA